MTKVVITGANRGIGLALVQTYLAQGCDVVAVCRKASTALANSSAQVIEGIDVTDEQSLQQLASALEGTAIDILINNAGILSSETLNNMDFASIARQFEVNAMAPLRVTDAVLPCLQSGSKVALITSRMGSIADNGSGGYYGYRMSKAALNAAGTSLAIDLKPRSVAVAILHPGFVQTDMVGGAGDISAKEAASRLAARIEELNMANSGSFWHSNGELLPW